MTKMTTKNRKKNRKHKKKQKMLQQKTTKKTAKMTKNDPSPPPKKISGVISGGSNQLLMHSAYADAHDHNGANDSIKRERVTARAHCSRLSQRIPGSGASVSLVVVVA